MHLAPGGLLAFDIPNPSIRELSPAVSSSVQLEAGPGSGPWTALEEVAAYDAVQQVRVTQWRVDDGGGRTRELRPHRTRIIFPQELELLLQVEGLELAARHGDFDGSPFTGASPSQVCLARLALDRSGK
jgi:hypothetical protein